jgi:hypothetical protein
MFHFRKGGAASPRSAGPAAGPGDRLALVDLAGEIGLTRARSRAVIP